MLVAALNYKPEFARMTMKEVYIYSSASCDWDTRKGSYFAALEYQGYCKYITGEIADATVDACILTGLAQAVHLIREPCKLVLVTATRLAFNREGKPKGQNRQLKQLLLDMLKSKQCEFQFDEWLGLGDRLRQKLAELERIAKKVEPIELQWNEDPPESKAGELFG